MNNQTLSQKRAAAGRQGGLATLAKHGPDHFAAAGRKGAAAFHAKYHLKPIGINDFAIVEKSTGIILPRTLCGLSIDKYIKGD